MIQTNDSNPGDSLQLHVLQLIADSIRFSSRHCCSTSTDVIQSMSEYCRCTELNTGSNSNSSCCKSGVCLCSHELFILQSRCILCDNVVAVSSTVCLFFIIKHRVGRCMLCLAHFPFPWRAKCWQYFWKTFEAAFILPQLDTQQQQQKQQEHQLVAV